MQANSPGLNGQTPLVDEEEASAGGVFFVDFLELGELGSPGYLR